MLTCLTNTARPSNNFMVILSVFQVSLQPDQPLATRDKS